MMILKHNAYAFWITDTKHCAYLFELLQDVTKYLFRDREKSTNKKRPQNNITILH